MGRIETYATHFCGVGGACGGLHAAGLKCKLAIDYLPVALEYRERNLGHKGTNADIAEYYEKHEKDEAQAADLLWTSPPCQTFSTARDSGYNKDDARNNLFLASLEYAKIYKPRFFVLENVTGLVDHDADGTGNSTLTMFRKAFSDIGYNVEWNLLNARDFGVAQSRPRIFVIGSLTGETGLIPREPGDRASFESVMEHGLEELAWGSTTYATAFEKVQRTGIGMTIVEEKDRLPRRGSKGNGLPRDVTPTLTCGFGGGPTRKKCAVLDKTKSGVPFLRDLSIREGARLQGFPDSWAFPESYTEAWRLIGNAVALPVAKAIAKHLIDVSEGKKPPAKEWLSKDEIKSTLIRQEANDIPSSLDFTWE